MTWLVLQKECWPHGKAQHVEMACCVEPVSDPESLHPGNQLIFSDPMESGRTV